MPWGNTLWLSLGAALGFAFCVFIGRGRRKPFAWALLAAAAIYLAFGLFRQAPIQWLAIEALGMLAFGTFAALGVKRSMGWLVAGWAFHPVWDFGLHHLGPGHRYAPDGYAMLCLSFDGIMALYLFAGLKATRTGRGSPVGPSPGA